MPHIYFICKKYTEESYLTFIFFRWSFMYIHYINKEIWRRIQLFEGLKIKSMYIQLHVWWVNCVISQNLTYQVPIDVLAKCYFKGLIYPNSSGKLKLPNIEMRVFHIWNNLFNHICTICIPNLTCCSVTNSIFYIT